MARNRTRAQKAKLASVAQEQQPYPPTLPSSHSLIVGCQDRAHNLEKDFFQDFACCGSRLKSLHDLLEHYETYHIRLVDESLSQKHQDQQQHDQSLELNDTNITAASSTLHHKHHLLAPVHAEMRMFEAPKIPSPTERQHSAAGGAFRKRLYYGGVNDVYYENSLFSASSDGGQHYSAFDDAVVHKRSRVVADSISHGSDTASSSARASATPSLVGGGQGGGGESSNTGADGFTTDEESGASPSYTLFDSFSHHSIYQHHHHLQNQQQYYTVAPALLSSSEDDDQLELDKSEKYQSLVREVLNGEKKRRHLSSTANADDMRKYRCLVPGCSKMYRNQNGLKYHIEHGHTVDERDLAERLMRAIREDPTEKPYACTIEGCTKRYRNSNGLKYHLLHHHE